MGRDPYLTLGVLPGATNDEIRQAWRRLSKQLHPDLGGDADAFREALEAYRSLAGAESTSPPSMYVKDVQVDWDIAIWTVDAADDTRWSYGPRRSVLTTIAIATALLTMVVILLTPALMR